jgi:hypothetical protein
MKWGVVLANIHNEVVFVGAPEVVKEVLMPLEEGDVPLEYVNNRL